jgi:SAM-dependent methyltransferase
MASSLAAISQLLSCPDDASPLRLSGSHLFCSSCSRLFPLHADNLAEILPRRPHEFPGSANPTYSEGYLQAFNQPYAASQTSLAWGAEESVSKSWAQKRRRQVAAVQKLITEEPRRGESILCDIAAGAGYYTFAYARCFEVVIHCDLSVENLSYSWRKARELHIDNIVFLRTDYFSLPFQQSLDRIVCLDTLIRGEEHDSVVLGSIARSLKPGGSAVVDFHNWWHNPIRRLGMLRDNFCGNKSYKRSELGKLFGDSGIHEFEIKPFVQEVDADGLTGRLLTRLIPPTRFMVRVPQQNASILAPSGLAVAK